MKRIISFFLCLLILSFTAIPIFADEHNAYMYFWGLTAGDKNIEQVDIEEFDNDEPFDPGIDNVDHKLLIGGIYKNKELVPGAKYRFDITLVLTPTVSILTDGYEHMYKLSMSKYIHPSYQVYYSEANIKADLVQMFGPNPTITRNASTITFSFTDVQWTAMDSFKDETYVAYYLSFPKQFLSLSADMYLANLYFGLESEYDEEAYSREVNEKLTEINNSLHDMSGKLDDLFDQEDEHHQEVIDQAEEHHEENKGLFQSIIDGITNLPGLIMDGIKGLFDEIVSTVTGSIENAMNGFLEKLKDKLGILYQAPDYFVRVIQSIMVVESTNELIFPSMVIPVDGEEYTLNEPTPFQIFPDWVPQELYAFINLSFSVLVIFSVINYAEKKWEEIMRNG